MIKAYWGITFNPFEKNNAHKVIYESDDYKQATARLEHLKATKGFGLFTGEPGTGKTYTIKKFNDSLNPSMYKPVYLPLSSLSQTEFYRSLAIGLDLIPSYKKIDLFNSIQERILTLSKDKRITPVIFMDECQCFSTKVLNDLKIIFNFEMDSVNHAIVVMIGNPIITRMLSLGIHESLAQRIVINYSFHGLSKEEIANYLDTKLKSCGSNISIFSPPAIESIATLCKSSPRILNSLADKCLILGSKMGSKYIETDIVMIAYNEIVLT